MLVLTAERMKKEDKKIITGTISINSKGVGFVTVEGSEQDIQIDTIFLNTALHGDEVEVSLLPRMDTRKLNGEVVRVIKRAKMQFVGTVDKDRVAAFVIPDDTRMYTDIILSPEESKDLRSNLKVLVEIVKWTDPKKPPEGKLIRVIGKKGENDVEMEAIVLEKGFQIGFPAGVMREAEALEKKSKPIPAADIAARRDFRPITTFTIDPVDAKDFDDAISFRELVDGLLEIGVHIADVSHYVRHGTAIDKEAIHRGVSIYLVDRTIPMLPEVLSNDICSLNPHEDKLTYSAVLTMTPKGELKDVWLGRTVINSNRRFTYEDAQKVLDDKKGDFYHELNVLNTIAKIFREKRMKGGAIDFEKDEVKFKLDETGHPVGIIKKVRLDVHKLVEEYMILANREVAAYLSREIKRINKGASIYRIHDLPKKEATAELIALLRMLGYEVKTKDGAISSQEMNRLFEAIKNKPEESLIKILAMRSMAKAIYSTKNIGHYGLALEDYTHFTSPIRRYADLLVHRILEKHLKGRNLTQDEVDWHHSIAMELSEREMDATSAERDSIAYKQIEYMMDRIGDVYTGVISGISKWGVYVEETETQASGMIKFRDMADDMYIYNDGAHFIIGEKTKKKYSIGDPVKIKVVGGDLMRKTLDFVFAS